MRHTVPALGLTLLTLLIVTTSCGSSNGVTYPPKPDARDAALDASATDIRSKDALGKDALGKDALGKDALGKDALGKDALGKDALGKDALGKDALGKDALGKDAAPPKETQCDDGVDNDGDSKVDCLDPDCDQQRCRVTVGFCDAEETCSKGTCPADEVKAKGTVCRAVAGPCDIEETCDGISQHCPADKLAKATQICRTASGPCDEAESCNGLSPKCPPDVPSIKGIVCRPASGLCDEAELCDGAVATCPADKLVPASAKKVCRAKAGVCDQEELCNGSSASCPADAFLGPGTPTCRPSTGACDFAESCDGKSALCPTDVNGCQTNEYCSGGACLSKKAKGVSCSDSAECLSGFCEDKVCCDKSCGGACRSCKVAGAVGTCTNHAKGTDPEQGCGKYVCNGAGSCFDYCTDKTGVGFCNPHYFCAYGKCRLKVFNGTECTDSTEYRCMSGFCWISASDTHGTCCAPGCNKCCGDCSSGTCKPAPANTDASSCFSNYSCNGKGGYNTSCTADGYNCSAQCSSSAWCWQGQCTADLDPGAACLGGCQCKSNTCFPFVCW